MLLDARGHERMVFEAHVRPYKVTRAAGLVAGLLVENRAIRRSELLEVARLLGVQHGKRRSIIGAIPRRLLLADQPFAGPFPLVGHIRRDSLAVEALVDASVQKWQGNSAFELAVGEHIAQD